MMFQQILLESVTMLIATIFIFTGTAWSTAHAFRENVKLECLERNVEAAQEIQEIYRQTGEISTFEYLQAEGKYTTSVKSAECLSENDLYRLEIETTYRGEQVGETEVTVYAAKD